MKEHVLGVAAANRDRVLAGNVDGNNVQVGIVQNRVVALLGNKHRGGRGGLVSAA